MKPKLERKPIEVIFTEVGTVEQVLTRHGYDTSFRNLHCPAPDHDDREPGSVKILPSSEHPGGRIFCHSCGLNEDAIGLARLLGERIEFMQEVDEKQPLKRILDWRPPTFKDRAIRKTVLKRQLENDPTIEKDWIAAKTLARLGNKQAVQQEILRDYEYLTNNFNLPRVWELVQKIWDYGSQVHGLPTNPDDPKSMKSWVDKVAKELER